MKTMKKKANFVPYLKRLHMFTVPFMLYPWLYHLLGNVRGRACAVGGLGWL
jgi:hypothetical protein